MFIHGDLPFSFDLRL
jgi:hypothetical protein